MLKTFVAVPFLLLTPTAFADQTPQEAARAYLESAHTVLDEVQKTAADANLVIAEIDALLENAKPVITAWAGTHTQCAEQVAKVIELYPEINVWTPTEIRQKIEGGQALPAAEGCYAGRDVVAHPAITRALVRTGITAQSVTRLTREMNEAVEHMEEIATEIGAL